MNENEKKSGWLPILGYVALSVVLFIGIKVVFAGLGRAIPKTEDVQPQFTALDNREGQQVSYGLRLLTDEEAQSDEVRQWLGKAQEQAGPDAGAYWLRKEAFFGWRRKNRARTIRICWRPWWKTRRWAKTRWIR